MRSLTTLIYGQHRKRYLCVGVSDISAAAKMCNEILLFTCQLVSLKPLQQLFFTKDFA